MAVLDDILQQIVKGQAGAFKNYSRLLARIESGMEPEPPRDCPKVCILKDQPLIGQKEFANFLGVSLPALVLMDKWLNIPHAVVGKRWVGTTHTLMAWVTRLVEDEVRFYNYDLKSGPIFADPSAEPADPEDVYPPPKRPHVRGVVSYLRQRREKKIRKTAGPLPEFPAVKPVGPPKRKPKRNVKD